MTLARIIIGWVLLIAGIALIGWTLYTSYNIFTAKAEVPVFFEAEEEVVETQINTNSQDIQAQLHDQLQNIMGEQLKSVIPSGSMPKIMNLMVWSILAGILIFGGSQFASLGIKLLKP